MNLATLDIDWAKTPFSIVGMDQHGKIVLRKTLKRAQVLKPFQLQIKKIFNTTWTRSLYALKPIYNELKYI